jgi:hypothetical protein
MKLIKKPLAWLLILVPVISFYGFFCRYTVNAPVNDDYSAVLQFLNRYVSTSSWMEKLKLIFSQHGEHRIVFSRICSILSLKLEKQVNFNVLSFTGDLSLVGIALIFLRKVLCPSTVAFPLRSRYSSAVQSHFLGEYDLFPLRSRQFRGTPVRAAQPRLSSRAG